jgi:hypothetical protein
MAVDTLVQVKVSRHNQNVADLYVGPDATVTKKKRNNEGEKENRFKSNSMVNIVPNWTEVVGRVKASAPTQN